MTGSDSSWPENPATVLAQFADLWSIPSGGRVLRGEYREESEGRLGDWKLKRLPKAELSEGTRRERGPSPP